MRSTEYYVYVMSNASQRIYVGMTNNLERRVLEHRMKLNPQSFTYQHNMTMLVFMENFPDPLSAIAREKQIKGLLRSKKLGLVLEQNPEWRDLSADWYS